MRHYLENIPPPPRCESWDGLGHEGKRRLHIEAFECALRRLQPLNWDTAMYDIYILNKVEEKKRYHSHETVFMVHSGNCILASFHFSFILADSKSRIKLNLPETPRSHIIRLAWYFVSTL